MPAEPDPDLALRLAKALADLYGQAAADLLATVARRLARGIDWPGWAERKLLEVVALSGEAQRIVDRLAVLGLRAIDQAVTEAFEAGVRAGAVEAGAAFGVPNRLAVDAIVRETVTAVQSTHGQILRSVVDAYRQVITEAAGGLVIGARTRREAAQAALDRFASRGIAGFVDRAGRRWEIESYAEMALRTASGRAQVAGTLDRFAAAGRDLVIVSDHPQECRLCRPWEGRVLSISGGTPAGTVLEDGRAVAGSVAQAQSAGLQHANCRHNLTAYVVGLTQPPRATADPEGDAQRQEQRRLERGVRMWRRREAVALDDQARRRAAAKAAEWRGALASHVEEHGLARRRERERLGAR